jgi:hypothetical protein
MLASGDMPLIPPAMAAHASDAERDPLNLSGATMIFIMQLQALIANKFTEFLSGY